VVKGVRNGLLSVYISFRVAQQTLRAELEGLVSTNDVSTSVLNERELCEVCVSVEVRPVRV
jgi:hypothetical protein